ncbi:hypothetical protein ID47_05735 [Candidatus Paracaedibacter acanthamoebae]|uniref:Sel1 repeat protein n=2 Tax=Candidatus Odyssella acanthamoebae TaxID=91604 RepID=A0A077AVB4_9PROT|nr:hypothetical protein ID47_05735 [Candidatus Paracaedibacter acanthamoebae]
MESDVSQYNHRYSPLIDENQGEEDAFRLYQLGYSVYTAGTSSTKLKEQNFKEARDLLEKAVEKGQPNAAVLMGRMWEYGEGGVKDIKKAENLYLIAHRAGVMAGTAHLAELYKATNQIEKSFNLNLALASQGDARAQIAVGNIYLEGSKKGYKITPNFEAAIEWYKKAAAQGDLRADFALGRTYYFLKDYKNARDYLEKICQTDQAEKFIGKVLLGQAKTALANIYGMKGHENREGAIQLYQEAIALGNAQAKNKLKGLISF